MKQFPKILFVDINFRYDNSAGITISKLVDHIARKNLYLVSQYADEANIDIFSKKHQITEKEYRNKAGAKITRLAREQNKSEKKGNLKGSIKSILLGVFRVVVGAKIINRQFTLSEDLKKWLDTIKPDIVYTTASTLESVSFSLELSCYTKAKIMIHVLDDKANGVFPGISGFIYKRRFKKRFKDIVQKANWRLSISESMKQHFESVYAKKFISIHNPINEHVWLPYIKSDLTVNTPWTVIYSGMVEANASSILRFCDALSILKEQGAQFTFKLYARFDSAIVKKKLMRYSFVEVFDFVNQDSLPTLLSSADILFLPLSFRKKHANLHLSMPTKTTEYLISGVPTLVFAPEASAVAQFANQHNVACVVNNNNLNKLCKATNRLINDFKYREQLSQNAVKRILEHHTKKYTKEQFNSILSN